MSCQGCVKNVAGVLQALAGVDEVVVSLRWEAPRPARSTPPRDARGHRGCRV